MLSQPIFRISRTDLENLMAALTVDFVKLTEYALGPGRQQIFAAMDVATIHYNVAGTGRMIVGSHSRIDLAPHTLVIVPGGESLQISSLNGRETPTTRTMESAQPRSDESAPQRIIAGEGRPQLNIICGSFSATFGSSVDLLAGACSPIVEQFDAIDQLDCKLKSALTELASEEVGTSAMAAALLKQVLLVVLRRSLSSTSNWVERFSILKDPQIARAFADMVAQPSAPHCLNSLAQKAGLSRSPFITRFCAAFGSSPMAVLRQLRMRQAAMLLRTSRLAVEQVSYRVGYANHNSFCRAFHKTYGSDPSGYRAAARDRRQHCPTMVVVSERYHPTASLRPHPRG
jgi:AraC family transcriptional activator of mtrCDE